ncbi:MAG: molybdenum cofactor biosynthesis protein MoaE [Terracidiphilus sp.]|jgi:molybdopterin synthase catalytic subunit
MHVTVLPFGVLKEWFGSESMTAELPEGATVANLLELLVETRQAVADLGALRSPGGTDVQALRGIAVSVNAEYAPATHVLRDGDEVGLLPPVSGGAPSEEQGPGHATALTREPIDAERIVAASKQGEDGAVVVFDGTVRNNTRGRRTLYLDYEAYEAMAERQMRELALEAQKKFGVRQVTMIHRLGRLTVGETSVLIVVASEHRARAFDACRWLIDTLKKTVPIWKKETFADGVVWADGEPFPEGLAVERERLHEG